MSRPEDIPQDVWDAAFAAMPPINRDAYETSPYAMVLHLGFARAIMAERDRCARIAFCAYDRKTEICSRIVRKIRTGVER